MTRVRKYRGKNKLPGNRSYRYSPALTLAILNFEKSIFGHRLNAERELSRQRLAAAWQQSAAKAFCDSIPPDHKCDQYRASRARALGKL